MKFNETLCPLSGAGRWVAIIGLWPGVRREGRGGEGGRKRIRPVLVSIRVILLSYSNDP